MKFNDKDFFAGIDFIEADVTVGQTAWFMKHLPAKVADMGVLAELTVSEILDSVTFEAFWDKYNDKARSSRIKTKRVWDRMSRSEQLKAYHYIDRYVHNIPATVCKKYATTYLNDQLWNN